MGSGRQKKYTSPNQEMNQTDAPVLFPGWMHKGRLNQALSYPSSLLMCFVFTLGLLLSYLVIFVVFFVRVLSLVRLSALCQCLTRKTGV